MSLYHGIDCHSDNLVIFALEETGNFGKSQTVKLESEAFDNWLFSLSKEDYVALEASTNSFALYDRIKPHVKECYVLNPKKLFEIFSGSVKTDKKDCQKIAQRLRYAIKADSIDSDLPVVYVPNHNIRTLRQLFSTHKTFKHDVVRQKNKIHSLIKQSGKTIAKSSLDKHSSRVKIQNMGLDEVVLFQINMFFEMIDKLNEKIKELEVKIIKTSRPIEKEVKLITTIPGISLLGATAIMADIATIDRFDSPKKLCAYLRTAPKIDASNKKVHIKSVSKESRKLAIHYLIQGLNHFRKSSPHLDQFYTEKRKGKSAGKVRIAVCRKIISYIYFMLKRKKPYFHKIDSNYANKKRQYEIILKKTA